MAVESALDMDTGETSPKALRGVLQQNRKFLDFFWEIANPQQEIRLKAIESLIQYLKESDKADELKYTFKRLVDGLAATREVARPGFSLALAQVVKCFEEIPLSTVFGYIDEKYNLQRVSKNVVRKAAFGNFFGVLALFQSGRLIKDTKALLQCVQLLQSLSQYKMHLNNLPSKTLVDILSEIPESTFEEVLFEGLRSDLTSAFSTPEQLHLLLVGIQRFPGVLKPKKLKKLFGSSTIFTDEMLPKLLDLLKMAAKSVKKERCLPGVAMDMMKVSIKEGAFELFWKQIVEDGLMQEQFGPCIYMCLRLLGAALPLLDKKQLQLVLKSKVMLHYGNHVVSTQPIDRFKFAPEMETYVDAFLENCDDTEKQLMVLISFSSLTNQGYPVVSSAWAVIQHLKPAALQKYIDWLKKMFLSPDLDSLLDFSTKRQQEKQEQEIQDRNRILRLRRWIISRLASIIDSAQKKLDEDQVMDIARFILFHAFFKAKKSVSDIPETEVLPTLPLEENIRGHVAEAFFSLLLKLNNLPALGESSSDDTIKERHVGGVTADGSLWIHCMVCYANLLLSRGKVVEVVKPFSDNEKDAWNRMLKNVEDLQKKIKKSNNMELSAYQQLLLLVGIHIFKTPEESVDLLNDIHNCLEKALSKKVKKKKEEEGSQNPEWVEVMVEIILSLLSQPSKLFRVISKNVFRKMCLHMTSNALQLVLNVFDPEEEQSEESAVVVTDEREQKINSGDQENETSSDEDGSEEGDQEDDEKESDEEEELGSGDVNEVFRKQLMEVLHAGHAMEGDDSDEDLDDETMMALDENLSALFAEQKKRIQAKKDEKAKIRQEKNLRRDFKIKVLDLIEIFVARRSDSPLVFNVIEPLISVIERSMGAESSQQEQDLLRKTAAIFMKDLCKNKRYCKEVSELKDNLHDMMERLLKRAAKQSDSSVALYCFSASLYLLKVLRGNVSNQTEEKDKESSKDPSSEIVSMGCLDFQRVVKLYQESLNELMTKRNSPLTASMFSDLFNRFPFMCKPLLSIIMKSITQGARQHQQAEACTLLMKTLQNSTLKETLSMSDWQDLIQESMTRIKEMLQAIEEIKVKVDQEKLIKCFEILNFLIKAAARLKLDVNLTELSSVLQDLSQKEGFGKPRRMEDLYWNVMVSLGFKRPKKEKSNVLPEDTAEGSNVPKKEKGFLPESKKRKNRKKAKPGEQQMPSASKEESPQQEPDTTSKKKKKKHKKKKTEQQKCETEKKGQQQKCEMEKKGQQQKCKTEKRKAEQQNCGAEDNAGGESAGKKKKPNGCSKGKLKHQNKPNKKQQKARSSN